MGGPWLYHRGFSDGVCPWLLERSDVRNVIMKKFWWQQPILRSKDQELKQRYDTTLRYHTQFSTPTAEELERRDKFFHQLHEELSCKMDGPDLIEEIPDIDLEE